VRKGILIGAIAFAAAAIFGVTALATPGGGVSGTMQIRGTLPRHVNVNADRIQFQTRGNTDVVSQTFTYSAGGFSGWHTHPGLVLAVVESGALKVQVGCSIHTYSVGQSFYESGTTPIQVTAQQVTIVHVTYIVPKGVNVRREVSTSQTPHCDD
jgi:quercetin dioxygenase-like cupin family protein